MQWEKYIFRKAHALIKNGLHLKLLYCAVQLDILKPYELNALFTYEYCITYLQGVFSESVSYPQ